MICIGVITGARGLKGEVWVKSFTGEPGAVAGYGPVSDDAGRALRLAVVGSRGDKLACRIDGIEERSEAESLKGHRLYIPRTALPAPAPDEFYHVDLIGLAVELAENDDSPAVPFGRVRAVHDHGAGTVLEVASSGHGVLMVPFTRAAVPDVDLTARRIVIAPLPGLLAPASEDA